ncbi:hypothetical protein BGZ96_003256 [Linnemannia gamsii]|uniref:BHLH domain-containing protein n=1 Tax=Linnemannia gamsii TaxID=64522 RepID=A0ABQ7JJE7_9FUNG|nr:hypothetical protein BGZ96_003256 [Linnemannia gamsii]
MMPPPRSPMILPSASQNHALNTQRQLSLVQPQHITVQNQHQLSIHQPISAAQPSPALKPIAENGTAKKSSGSAVAEVTPTTGAASVSIAPKSALAPVTPASLMNLGAGSGSESTPTSSPKFGVHAKAKSGASHSTAPVSASVDTAAAAVTTAAANSAEPTSAASAPSSTASTSAQKRGTKRQANGDVAIGSGILAPSTPRQVPLTPGSSMISPMPPPANGFSLISPALKPTLMNHRGSTSMMVSPRMQPLLVSPSLKPWLPGVSPSEAMARLASKSNYQNILDGDHTALGLSYNTDLHSGIELRRTSHKAAEQKRRDSLKNCFDDLRHMIPNIQEKSPSKVFLLKKSFDYICNLKAEVANRDLELARVRAEHEFMKNAMQAWMTTLPDDSPFRSVAVTAPAKDEGEAKEETTKQVGLLESWTIPEEELKKAISKETNAAARAAEIAEMSALAVEAARTQPGGQSKGGKDSQGDGEDSDEDGSATPKAKKPATNKSGSGSKGGSSSNSAVNKKPTKGGPSSTPASALASSIPSIGMATPSETVNGVSSIQSKDGDTIMEPLPPAALPLATKSSQANGSKVKDGKVDEDEDDDDDDDDESEDQEMADAA